MCCIISVILNRFQQSRGNVLYSHLRRFDIFCYEIHWRSFVINDENERTRTLSSQSTLYMKCYSILEQNYLWQKLSSKLETDLFKAT